MKKVFVVLFAAFWMPALLAQGVNQLYTEAQREMLRGDLDSAKLKFMRILEQDPAHTGAKNSLRIIQQRQQQDPGRQLRKRLAAYEVPSVRFKQASLESAVDYLRQRAQEDTGEAVNFVIPPDKADKKVTLSLNNIPFTEVVRYLAEQTGTEVVYERHAVRLRNPGG